MQISVQGIAYIHFDATKQNEDYYMDMKGSSNLFDVYAKLYNSNSTVLPNELSS